MSTSLRVVHLFHFNFFGEALKHEFTNTRILYFVCIYNSYSWAVLNNVATLNEVDMVLFVFREEVLLIRIAQVVRFQILIPTLWLQFCLKKNACFSDCSIAYVNLNMLMWSKPCYLKQFNSNRPIKAISLDLL